MTNVWPDSLLTIEKVPEWVECTQYLEPLIMMNKT
jgi:hypothetical protein